MPRLIPLLALTLLLSACTTARQAADNAAIKQERLDLLTTWLTGSYTTTQQAASDPDYADLEMRITRLWPDRADGPWLLREIAPISAPGAPADRRVYRLAALERQEYRADVYDVPPNTNFTTAKPDALIRHNACALHIEYHVCSNFFTGTTHGRACRPNTPAAAYSTHEVSITPEGVVAWERCFDANDHQVSGPAKGGYRFVKH